MKSIKFLTGASLFLFFVTVTSLLTASFVTRENNRTAKTNGIIVGLKGVNEGGAVADGTSEISFLTLEKVAVHNTQADCWMVISGAVYNFSPFLAAHPGGAASMVPYCGKDGTQAFATKDKNPSKKHSALADSMLSQYFIGRLGQEIASASNTSTSTSKSVSSSTVVPTSRVTTSNTTTTTSNTTNSNISLTTAEVSRHNSLADCWLIISGRVYNVTSYIAQHPGGANSIARHCGTDSTTAFATKDTGSSHSSFASNLLNNYLIGSVGSSVAVTQPTPTNPPVANQPTSTPRPPTAAPTPVPSNLVLDMAEVARHSSLSDCWIVVSNVVYDVTRYISQHPGGAAQITNMCGKESTQAFQTRGGGNGNHSNNAYNLLANYRIGNLNTSVNVVPTNTPVPGQPQPTNTPVPQTGSNLPQAILDKYPGSTRRSGSYEDNGSWEGKINTSTGACRAIKVSSGGSITQDEPC